MKLAGENVLLRIFVDTFKKWHHVPVYEAIIERARRDHLSGTTVLEGVEGFGQSGEFHKDSLCGIDINGKNDGCYYGLRGR